MEENQLKKCRLLAQKVRKHCLEMVCKGKSGHIGSMLSMADILPVLYTQILNVDSANPKMLDRDRFILSKGHGGAALLAREADVNGRSEKLRVKALVRQQKLGRLGSPNAFA